MGVWWMQRPNEVEGGELLFCFSAFLLFCSLNKTERCNILPPHRAFLDPGIHARTCGDLKEYTLMQRNTY